MHITIITSVIIKQHDWDSRVQHVMNNYSQIYLKAKGKALGLNVNEYCSDKEADSSGLIFR